MVEISVPEVQAVYGNKSPSFDTAQQNQLVSIAENITEDVFGGRITRQNEIEGNEADFAKYLAAHLWEIAEGGETNSQSQSGGSVNFQHLQTNIESTLAETRYGRLCLMMTRSNTSTGIVRSDF